MRTIWKFALSPEQPSVIYMPRGAEVLTVQVQGPGTNQEEKVMVWALVDTEAPNERRVFYTFGTGHEIPPIPLTYLGTFQLRGGSLVFHVFEGA